MVLTVSFALSLVTGLSCHHRSRWNFFLRKLDTSVGVSGPHDFAVRHSAARLASPPRPPHPASTFVTIAIRPSCEAGRGELVEMICPTGKAEYFCQEGWTRICARCPSGKSVGSLHLAPLAGRGRIACNAIRVKGIHRELIFTLHLPMEASHPNPLPVKNGERESNHHRSIPARRDQGLHDFG